VSLGNSDLGTCGGWGIHVMPAAFWGLSLIFVGVLCVYVRGEHAGI